MGQLGGCSDSPGSLVVRPSWRGLKLKVWQLDVSHGGTGSASEVLNLNTGRACEAIKGLLESGHRSRFLETWPIIFNADSR